MAYTTINDPSVQFQIALYTGTSASKSVTFSGNANLQPDMMWIKSRSNATNQNLYDSSRGSTERLYPNLTSQKDTVSGMTFNSDGFTTGTNSVGDINVDGNVLGTYPTTINYVLGDTVNVSSIIDPLYGFSSWSSDSNTIMPQNTSENMSFYANHHDNITLNLYLLPTITAFISGSDTICSNKLNAANINNSEKGRCFSNVKLIIKTPNI